MRILLVAVLAVGLGAFVGAEPPRPSAVPPPEVFDSLAIPTRMVDDGIKQLKTNGVAGLCGLAFAEGSTVNNPMERASATGHFQRLRDAMIVRFGKSSGEFELIRREVIGSSIAKFTYLEKLEKTAVVWKFVFYRVGGDWKWKDLGVTDNLDPEFRPADGR